MMALLKKQKVATAAFLLFCLPLLYFSLVAIKAYLHTLAIISSINQSVGLTFRLEVQYGLFPNQQTHRDSTSSNRCPMLNPNRRIK